MSTSRPAKPCPICKQKRVAAYAPFCSERCRDRDLARWLNEGYALPGEPAYGEDLAQHDAGAHNGGEED